MRPKHQLKEILKQLTGEEAEIKTSAVADFGTSAAFKLAPKIKKSPSVINL